MKPGFVFVASIRVARTVQRFLCRLLALFSIAAVNVAAQSSVATSGSWSGMVVSSACNADEAFNESPECVKNLPGAKLSLYDDTNRVMYGLEPQNALVGHLGNTVTVRGALSGDTIQVTSIQPMSIGLAVGEKAPGFSIRDQFDRIQSLDTLKGPKGTVLLFFRSADW